MEQTEQLAVLYECDDRIATITLNRPAKLNAFNDDMVKQLQAAFDRFDMDDEAHIAILCGSGRAFSSGADVRQRQMKSRELLEKSGGPASRDSQSKDLLSWSVNWKPVIAAVHGYAVGMATSLALECDLVVCETGAKFQVTETSRGTSGAGKVMALISYRGRGSFATEAALTGRFFTAEEALAAGVIDRVAPSGRLMETARELATAVNRNPPLSVRAAVMQRRWEIEDRVRESRRYASLNKLYLSEDFHEAARAFAEKRPAGPFKAR